MAALERELDSSAALDFRIAVLPSALSPDERKAALDSLATEGPDPQLPAGDALARWFPLHPNARDNFFSRATNNWYPHYLISELDRQPYLLCYDNPDHSLTHNDPSRKAWALRAQHPLVDPIYGGIVLPFRLDVIGSVYMRDLTTRAINQPLAILFDNHVLTAPNVQSALSDSGVITYGTPTADHPAAALQAEADALKQKLDQASLPSLHLKRLLKS